MVAEHEIEELQLQVESKVCVLGVDAQEQLPEHLQVETKVVEGLALSMKIREQIAQDLSEADDKKMFLVGLIEFVNGKPPSLEGDPTEDKTVKVTVNPLYSTEKVTQEAQGAETKVNVDISNVLKREIHGIVVGDNFKDGLSFVSLARQN